MAATWRSPAAAGLPLLTAYLITAANGQAALALRFFLVPVVLWLLMLHTTARAGFSRWSTANAAEESEIDEVAHDRDALRSFSLGALKLGALGVVLALVVPLVVPHFPPRYLTEGLGRSRGWRRAGVGRASTTPSTSAGASTTATRRRSSATRRQPSPRARCACSRRRTTPEGSGCRPGGGNGSGQPQPLPPASQRRDYVIDVTDNTLAAPRIAVPYPVVAVAMEGTPWAIDPITRDVRVGRSVGSYRVTYADLAPSPPQLRDSGTPDSPDVTDDDLAVPDTVRTPRPALVRRGDRRRRQPARPRDRDPGPPAWADYTYNLDLGEPLRDETGRLMEPIRNFYETRRGYCVQFATAMIMMARAQGIPARMAIGFLPGQAVGTDKYIVKASDAHSWPELFFQGYGWLRFEPTPGARAGSPPPYAVLGSDAGATGGGRSVTESGSTGRATSSAAPTTTAVVAPAPDGAGRARPGRLGTHPAQPRHRRSPCSSSCSPCSSCRSRPGCCGCGGGGRRSPSRTSSRPSGRS